MNENNQNSKVYTVNEMAKVLKIGRSKAYELASVYGFPTKRVGKRILIPKDGLDEWLRDHEDFQW
ncbi:helix-turn-helix domain-containing protein [Tyzzerella sp. OttesenSCG-928-J15]|nr:helix-turn-helix domain-containing protein [Tyzzerella sp. OttesenSCG-928-J15]